MFVIKLKKEDVLREKCGMKKALISWDKIIVTAAVAIVLAVCYYLRVPCAFNYVTGLPCLTCGMTRAWLSVIRLDFVSAYGYHQLFWTVPILYLYFLFDGELFGKKLIDRPVFFGILTAFVIRWIVILINFFIK